MLKRSFSNPIRSSNRQKNQRHPPVGAAIALAAFGLTCTAMMAFPTAAFDRSKAPETRSKAVSPDLTVAHAHTDKFFDDGDLFQAVKQIELTWEGAYETYFGTELSEASLTTKQIAAILKRIGRRTGQKPALIYMVPADEQLELVLITPGRPPLRQSIPAAHRESLLTTARSLRREITDPRKTGTTSYLDPAQQLYQWLIAPLEAELQKRDIETLLFCVGTGLRSLPLAALHDGQQFLVEKYNFALIPGFNMMETRYGDIRDEQVLAMGASQFRELPPLPAVSVEMETIAPKLWRGRVFLNERFTLQKLRSQLQRQRYGIVHLATHAEFQPGKASNSYIQLWDTKLTLDEMRDLPLESLPVELMVLSACRTALGDPEAEMGFAGLAVNSGVKSALASLWYVSDAGTLALMTEFYQQLRSVPIKAEALQEAQMAMLKGAVRLEGDALRGTGDDVSLPPELTDLDAKNLSHPFYWAAFTLVGSPW